MIFSKPLPFISEFADKLDQGIQEIQPNRKLPKIQRGRLSLCLAGILLSGTVCRAAFERASLGGCKQAARPRMFRRGKPPRPPLLHVSIMAVLRHCGIAEGEIAGDDTEKKRA